MHYLSVLSNWLDEPHLLGNIQLVPKDGAMKRVLKFDPFNFMQARPLATNTGILDESYHRLRILVFYLQNTTTRFHWIHKIYF